MMQDKKKYIASLLFFGALIAATFYFLLHGSELPSLFQVIRRVNPLFLLGGFALMFLFVFCEAVNTKGMLKSFGYRRSIWTCLKYAFIGFYFSSITPSASGGQPMQVYYMSKDQVPVGVSSLDMLLVTLSYQSGMVFLGLALFFLKMPLILGRIGVLKFFLLYGIIINLFCIALFICVVFHKTMLSRAAGWCVRMAARLHLVKDAERTLEKLQVQMDEYQRGAAYLQKNTHLLLRMFCVTLIQLLARLSITFVLYKAFGLNSYSYLDVLALQTVLAISVESLPLPGAVGATEAGFLSVNSVIFGAGLLLPVMLVSRGVSYYGFLLISGGITLTAHLRTLRRDRKATRLAKAEQIAKFDQSDPV